MVWRSGRAWSASSRRLEGSIFTVRTLAVIRAHGRELPEVSREARAPAPNVMISARPFEGFAIAVARFLTGQEQGDGMCWVSCMRTRTTTPEAKVIAAIPAIAQGTPNQSASSPESSAPTA